MKIGEGGVVNEFINKWKREELKGKTNKELVQIFDELCKKDEPTIMDGIKIGYLYGWILVTSFKPTDKWNEELEGIIRRN